uniref:Protein-L-isoaspartate O-methyltransferase n=1 Tax=Panagrolaimus sp. JU765 TaxID=591449 RepID=A0AC34PU91_9BILA
MCQKRIVETLVFLEETSSRIGEETFLSIISTIFKFIFTILTFTRILMAWRSHGRTNSELVMNLFRNKQFANPRVQDAMLAVDRADFTDIDPYSDCPQSIGSNATISAPHMHAAALEALVDKIDPKNNPRILDVGSGSGYLTVCFAMLAGKNGKSIGIEHMPELVHKSIANVKKHHSDMIESGQIELVVGDGRLGYPEGAPYDAIHVGAAAPDYNTTQKLLSQLKIGGRMVVPVGKTYQDFVQFDRISEDKFEQKKLMEVIYVPLTSQEHQRSR